MSPSRTIRDRRHARLLAQARRGNAGAFRRLYGELYEPLARYLGPRAGSPARGHGELRQGDNSPSDAVIHRSLGCCTPSFSNR